MKPDECCGWPGKTTPECLEFDIGDEVETPFSGEWTRHKVVARFRSKFFQSKVCYIVEPRVPKQGLMLGGKMDAAWFRKSSHENRQVAGL